MRPRPRLRKHPAAFPEVLVTSSRTGTGMPELRAAMVRLLRERALMNRAARILIVLAAVMGADGVILAAASAHGADASRLASASSMLLFHATAVLGAVALAERGIVHARIGAAGGFRLRRRCAACSPAT